MLSQGARLTSIYSIREPLAGPPEAVGRDTNDSVPARTLLPPETHLELALP